MKIINSKAFRILVGLFIIGILLGIITFIMSNDKTNDIINYFDLIKNNKFNYINNLFNNIYYNNKTIFLIWICGFIFPLVIIIPFLVIFKGISISFTISSIIYSFKLKGVLLSLILLFPCTIINILVIILISYYYFNYCNKTYNIFKSNKSINIKNYFKNYFYQYIILSIVLMLSILFETYITSNIFKFVL